MLLKALYDYARKQQLLEKLPLEVRVIHALIALSGDGKLRHDHLIRLTRPDKKGKESPGQERLMPRFPGENNGGKAYFLAGSATDILGCDKSSGSRIPVDPKEGRNPTKSFKHFWEQIQQAYEATHDLRLAALLAFKAYYITEQQGEIANDLPFLEIRFNKKDDPELFGNIGQGNPISLKTATIGFSVDGQPLTLEDENDTLREYWLSEYRRRAFQGEADDGVSVEAADDEPTLCLVTGQLGQTIARSHNPKISGVPGLSSGRGYLVSFAEQAPAFSSYGFKMGWNAPVSEQAASAYVLAINDLLSDNDTHIKLGPVSVCSWAKESAEAPKRVNWLLSKAYPEQVGEFLRAPFAGIADREDPKRDRLYTVALSGNARRVVVRHWIDQTLDGAIQHCKRWWEDLQIAELYQPSPANKNRGIKKSEENEVPASPYAIPNLVRTTLRRSKKQTDDKLVGERIVLLYRAALEGTVPPISLLKPVLDEFYSALVKNDETDEKKRTYPFSQSRFALIKLILIRNRKEGGFMPTRELADTPDPAYNLGRLLAVFENLQDKYHNYEKKGAGIVERYYAAASSAPASAFPVLCRLARHHLSKVRREDGGAAYRIEERITEIMGKFHTESLDGPPTFPKVLTLEEQGRFALGFYQQKAFRYASKDAQEHFDEQPI